MSLWICLGSVVKRLGFREWHAQPPCHHCVQHFGQLILRFKVTKKTGSTEWMWECLPWPCPQREQRMGNRNQEALHELWVCICVCVVYVLTNKKSLLFYAYIPVQIYIYATCLHVPSAITKRFSWIWSTGFLRNILDPRLPVVLKFEGVQRHTAVKCNCPAPFLAQYWHSAAPMPTTQVLMIIWRNHIFPMPLEALHPSRWMKDSWWGFQVEKKKHRPPSRL